MSQLTATQLKLIAKKYNLKLLYLFGSRARGDERKNSDTDIAFLGYKTLTAEQEITLITELSLLFKNLNRGLDLINLSSATPLMRYMVATEGKKLYGTTLADNLFYCHALKNYIDSKPIFSLTKNFVQSYVNL